MNVMLCRTSYSITIEKESAGIFSRKKDDPCRKCIDIRSCFSWYYCKILDICTASVSRAMIAAYCVLPRLYFPSYRWVSPSVFTLWIELFAVEKFWSVPPLGQTSKLTLKSFTSIEQCTGPFLRQCVFKLEIRMLWAQMPIRAVRKLVQPRIGRNQFDHFAEGCRCKTQDDHFSFVFSLQ